jgi:hypothetical protein
LRSEGIKVYPRKKPSASDPVHAGTDLEYSAVIDDQMRRKLARLADALIPAADEYLSASEAGVAGPLLDEILAMRPDIRSDVAHALKNVGDKDPHRALDGLHKASPRLFELLTATVVAAYFMHPDVRRRLDHMEGRSASEPSQNEFDDKDRDLLEPVRRRGYIYRRVPLEAWAEGSAKAEAKPPEAPN